MAPSQIDIITTGEAGRMIGRSARTVQRLIESGELPTVGKLAGVNGHFLLDRAVVETLVAKYRADRPKA
jgi:excisionase family DNA binding protein